MMRPELIPSELHMLAGGMVPALAAALVLLLLRLTNGLGVTSWLEGAIVAIGRIDRAVVAFGSRIVGTSSAVTWKRRLRLAGFFLACALAGIVAPVTAALPILLLGIFGSAVVFRHWSRTEAEIATRDDVGIWIGLETPAEVRVRDGQPEMVRMPSVWALEAAPTSEGTVPAQDLRTELIIALSCLFLFAAIAIARLDIDHHLRTQAPLAPWWAYGDFIWNELLHAIPLVGTADVFYNAPAGPIGDLPGFATMSFALRLTFELLIIAAIVQLVSVGLRIHRGLDLRDIDRAFESGDVDRQRGAIASLTLLAMRRRDNAIRRLGELLEEPRLDAPAIDPEIRFGATNALQLVGKSTGRSGPILEAIEGLRGLLREWPKPNHPMEWAGTQMSLGSALSTVGERHGDEIRLEAACDAFRRALSVWTRDEAPQLWAAANNNLGQTLLILDEVRQDPNLLDEAHVALRAALSERTYENRPWEWATSQLNLGNLVLHRGIRERDPEKLKEALEAFEAALSVHSLEAAPESWALLQNSIGSALAGLGEIERDPALLEAARDAFRRALEVNTKAVSPHLWASGQTNIAGVANTRFSMSGDPESLREAVDHYRAALTAYSPRDRWWGTLHYHLGFCLSRLGIQSQSDQDLLDAADAFRTAIASVSPDEDPDLWSEYQSQLGVALLNLGVLTQGGDYVDKGLDALSAATQPFSPADQPEQWVASRTNLAQALRQVGETRGPPTLLWAAAEAYREAARGTDRDRDHARWGSVQHALADTLIQLGRLMGNSVHLEEAAPILENLLSDANRDGEGDPADWERLGEILGQLGSEKADPALLARAGDALAKAVDGTPADDPVSRARRMANLGATYKAIGKGTRSHEHLQRAVETFGQAIDALDGIEAGELLKFIQLQQTSARAALIVSEAQPDSKPNDED